MSRHGKNKRTKKNKLRRPVRARKEVSNGCFILGLWFVTLAFAALVGIPMWRAVSAGRHWHTDLSLVVLVLVMIGASVITTGRWLWHNLGPPSKH